MVIRHIAAVIVLAIMAAPAFGCYSGLTIIPTTDMVGKGQYSMEMQIDGTIDDATSDTRVINTQFGLSDRFEAGVDFDVSIDSKTRTLLNAKYLLRPQKSDGLSLAAGVSNLEPSVKSNPFLVATKEFSKFRLHFGGLRSEGSNYWFTGLDKTFNDKFMLMCDYTNGDDNYSSVGFNYQFTDRYALMFGAQFPNSSDGDSLYTMHFVICGSAYNL